MESLESDCTGREEKQSKAKKSNINKMQIVDNFIEENRKE